MVLAVGWSALAQTPGGMTLPEVTVESKKAPPKAAKKAAPKQAPAAPTPVVQSTPQPAAESGRSPVEGYLATESGTATKSDTPLRETPASVSVVGTEQMRDQGVQTLQEAVRYVPGVMADSFGLDSRSDNVVIRGVPAAYFIDGLRTTYGYYTTTAPIEPYALERIEVLRGPAAMLYGQSPAGGIINGISKLPHADPYGEVTVEYGSFDFKQVKFDFTGPVTTDGKWLYRITGLARDADTQVDFVEDDRYMIQPSLTYRPNSDTSVTLLANLRRDDGGSVQQFLPREGTLTPVPGLGRVPRDAFLGEPGDYYDTEQQSVSLLFDHKFNNAISIHHGMRYTHTDVSYDSTLPLIMSPARFAVLNGLTGGILDPSFLPFLGAPGQVARTRFIEEAETHVFNTDTYLTARLDTGELKHKLTAGIDVMRFATSSARAGYIDNVAALGQAPFNIFDPIYGQQTFYLALPGFGLPAGTPVLPSDVALNQDPSEVQTQTGIYLQDQMKLGPWTAILGVRQDWLSMELGDTSDHDSALTWRGGLMYETSFGLIPYVSYSQSFTPQLGTIVYDDLFALINPRAAGAREGEQIEVGVKYQPKGAPFAINAAIYELKESNLVVSPDTIFNSLIGAGTRTRGFEIEAIGQLTPELKVVAAYAYTDAKYTSYPDPLSLRVGTQVETAPEHMASLWGTYTVLDGPLRGVSIGGGVRYIGSSVDVAPDVATLTPIEVKTPAYTLFDAMIAYDAETWRWQLTGQNLEDKYYVTTCQAFRGDCAIGQGRTLITSFTYRF